MKSVISELQWLGKGYFWQIWLIITTVLSGISTVIVSYGVENGQIYSGNTEVKLFNKSKLLRLLMIFLLVIFASLYITGMLVWEDFNYYDNSMFDAYTLQGRNYPPPITISTGRFFPLSHQEFNVIRLLTETVIGYHIFPIIELISSFVLLCSIDAEVPITIRAVLAIFILITSGFLVSFVQLIFSERNIVFILLLIFLMIALFERTGSTIWACCIIIFVQLILYYKETSFIMVFCLGFGRIVFRLWIAKNEKRSLAPMLLEKQSLLDLSIIACGITYLIYYEIMRIGMGVSYAAARNGRFQDVALAYISTDFSAVTLTLVVLGRSWLILRRRTTPWVLWDSVAVGAVACAVAYVYVGLYSSYYLTLVDVVAVLYVGRLIVLSWAKRGLPIKIGAIGLAALIAVHDVAFSLYSLYEEKNIVHIKTEIADVIAQRYSKGHGPLNIFFPFSNPYVISEFAAYLDYRHMPVQRVDEEEGIEGRDAETDKLIMITPRTRSANDPARYTNINADGRCVPWLPYRCRSEISAASGDMVVILPDDQVAETKLADGTPASNQLVFEPWPRFSDRTIRMFLAPEATVRFEQGRIPDRWLTGAVMDLDRQSQDRASSRR